MGERAGISPLFMVGSKNIFLLLRSPCAKKVCASGNDDASTNHTRDQQNQ